MSFTFSQIQLDEIQRILNEDSAAQQRNRPDR